MTYAIDLSSSWNNQTVLLHAIRSQAPVLKNQALWADEQHNRFYAYDGSLSGVISNPSPPLNSLWQFIPFENTGHWKSHDFPASSNFSILGRATNGLYASGGGLGFALGGSQDSGTTVDLEQEILVPGLVMYNMSSEAWYNISALGYSPTGVALGGGAQFVPNFGTAGLLFVLGGTATNGHLAGTDVVYIFDLISQQWSTQGVTGTKPQPATAPCVVGVQGDDSTYEIFWYGGRVEGDLDGTISEGAVYVLSLPSFNWQKQNSTPETGRYFHSCSVVGNRQMLAVGGIVRNASSDIQNDDSIQDPWEQAIGVFDLTAMEWRDDYDPHAASYVTPDAVKDHYRKNGREPAWSNDVVKGWFTKTSLTQTNSTTVPGPDSGPALAPTSSAGSSGTHAGAIAGGTVGGVAGLSLTAFLILYSIRRQRHHRNGEPAHGKLTAAVPDLEYQQPEYRKPELTAVGNMKLEMDGSDKASEMAQKEVATSELPADERRSSGGDQISK
ncbi:MAG: hypothetical protein Q9167_005830 [Letrouitia subvulpina]